MSIEPVLMKELHKEVAAIAEYVAELRMAINSLRAPELAAERLPVVRSDLTAVRDATRAAADKILDTAEEILAAAAAGTLDVAAIEQRMMELMEACSFQDLNGQRLKRAEDALNAIENRLGHFADKALAGNGEVPAQDLQITMDERNSARMTHGPSQSALEQGDIDQLLKANG